VPKLPQLTNVENYRACEADLKTSADERQYWVDLFRGHFDVLAGAIAEQYPETSAATLAEFRGEYLAAMRRIKTEPDQFERIDILVFDKLRCEVQRRYGFHDPYLAVKKRENRLAIELLPDLLAELDATPEDEVVEKLARGLMAGNIFDLGAAAAIEQYNSHNADFRVSRAAQPERPWLVDGLDAWSERWLRGSRYEHVAFFVDNSGSDVCLGCIPLTRWMLCRGARVTLAANSGPALNDVTAPELAPLIHKAAANDSILAEALHDERLSVVASGGWAPLLDLADLSDECVNAVTDADLIILQGMGRAIESNYSAAFACDSLRSAVLKDEFVARSLGGKLFDCVFRLEPGV